MKKTYIGIILAVLFAFLATGTASAVILNVSPPVFDRPAGTYTYTVDSDGVPPLFIAWDPSKTALPGQPPWAYNPCTPLGGTIYECVVFGAQGVGIPNSFNIEVMEDVIGNPPLTHQLFSGNPDYSSGIILQETDPTAVRLTAFKANSNSNTALFLGSVCLVLGGVILIWKFKNRKEDLSI